MTRPESELPTTPMTEPQDDESFDAWIRNLDEGVIQGEHGYERGEFTVFPELWRPLYAEGLTPAQAWQRALDARGSEMGGPT